MKNKNILSILGFCGTCISFYIGAGFATMQEVVQYEASYGSLFIVVILVAASIYVYTNISFTTNAHRLKLERGCKIFDVYCSVLGKRIGKLASTFFDYFSAFFCYMSFIVMCGGANSIMVQQWGAPSGIGAIILTVLVITTTIFGLNGILKALSKLGAIIIAMILLVGVFSSISGIGNFIENLHCIDEGKYLSDMKQVGNGNPFVSGGSYGGFVVLWFASFLAEIGAKNKIKEVNQGMLLSALFIFGTSFICCIGLIGNVAMIASSDIPALILAGKISPVLAQIFAVIICVGIYTSAVPLLWTGIRRIAQERTKKYIVLTIIGGIIGCIIACYVPYKGLINVLYGLNGYLGFIIIIIMILYDIKTKMSKK